jgi:hypothetical protein
MDPRPPPTPPSFVDDDDDDDDDAVAAINSDSLYDNVSTSLFFDLELELELEGLLMVLIVRPATPAPYSRPPL